jgi:vitamin B12 transporter
LNIGTQTTADRTTIVPKTTINVNGNLDKFNYYASLNSTETTGISEAAVTAPAAYESDRFPE